VLPDLRHVAKHARRHVPKCFHTSDTCTAAVAKNSSRKLGLKLSIELGLEAVPSRHALLKIGQDTHVGAWARVRAMRLGASRRVSGRVQYANEATSHPNGAL